MSAAQDSSTDKTTIYVRLLDENVDVWRPVFALQVAALSYRILGEGYNPEIEKWEFLPGTVVKIVAENDQETKMLKAVSAIL